MARVIVGNKLYDVPEECLCELDTFLTQLSSSERLPGFETILRLKMADLSQAALLAKNTLKQLGTDVIQHQCNLSPPQVDNMDKQLTLCVSMLSVIFDRLEHQYIPLWQSIWSGELDRVIKEEAESRKCLFHLEMLQREMKQSLDLWEALKQLTIDRSDIKMENECSNLQFVNELTEFVALSKLKDTGGIGRIDREREKRQSAWLVEQFKLQK